MRLDRADWAIISRVMLSLVVQSLEAKLVGNEPTQERAFLTKLTLNIGELTENEQILRRLII